MIPDSLQKLLRQLQGTVSNEEIIAFLKQQSEVDNNLPDTLNVDLDSPTIGFSETLSPEMNANTSSVDNSEAIEPGEFAQQEQWKGNSEYRIQIELGRGGMATVWRAFDHRLNRNVALKRLHPENQTQHFEVENFIVEAQITAQLQHPGIVPIYDMSQDDSGNTFFTMREIEGQTLKSILTNFHGGGTQKIGDGWNLRRLIDLIHDVCMVLAYAHDRGVIHQDIKPANIMVGAYGEVLLLDWGIASLRAWSGWNPKWITVRTSKPYLEYRRGAVAGTPQYMAPELLSGKVKATDGQADVYAIGVMLFEVLTGEKPFVGTTDDILSSKRFSKGAPSVTKRLVKSWKQQMTPEPLVAICERAMHSNPDERYTDIRQVAKELQDWLDGVQQEEKARQILKEVDSLWDKIAMVNQQIVHHRTILSVALESIEAKTDLESLEEWSHWYKLDELRTERQSAFHAIQQQSHAAMMVAPQIPSIYENLLQIEYPDLTEALSFGHRRMIQKVEERMSLLMEPLPTAEQEGWRHKIELDKRATTSTVKIPRTVVEDAVMDAFKHADWITLWGLAGVGKTHLSWEVARRSIQDRNMQVVFNDVSNVRTVAELEESLFQLLSLQNIFEDGLSAISEAITQRGDVLLVVDNAEELSPSAVRWMGEVCDRTDSLKLFVTSRQPMKEVLNTVREHCIQLTPMSLFEGVELLSHHCMLHMPNWKLTKSRRRLLCDLVLAVDSIPLAIDILGGRLVDLSLRELHTRTMKQGVGHHGSTLYQTIESSVLELGTHEQELLYALSVFPQFASLEMIECVIERTVHQDYRYLETLEGLAKIQLLKRKLVGKQVQYSLLSSVRNYARQQLSDQRKQDILRRLADFCINMIEQRGHRNTWSKQDWSTVEVHQDILSLLIYEGNIECIKVLGSTLFDWYLIKGPWSSGKELVERVLSRPDHSELTRLYWMTQYNRIFDKLEDYRSLRTNVEQTLILIKEWDFKTLSTEQQTMWLRCMTYWYFIEGTSRNVEVQKNVEMELSQLFPTWIPHREILVGDQEYGSTVLFLHLVHANQLFRRGEVKRAIETVQPLVHIYRREGWNFQTATTLNRLGYFFHSDRQTARGIEFLLESLELFKELGNVSSINVMETIGMCHQRIGEYQQAIHWFNKSIETGMEFNFYSGSTFCNLGSIHLVLGDYKKALDNYHKGVRILQRKQMKTLEAIFLGNLALVHHHLGHLEEAKRLFLEDLDLLKNMDIPGDLGLVHGNFGNLCLDLNDLDGALTHIQKCIVLCADHNPLARDVFMASLGLTQAKLGMLEEAKKSIESQNIENFKTFKEEYIQALCKHIAVYELLDQPNQVSFIKGTIREMETSEYAENSLVKRWMRRVNVY